MPELTAILKSSREEVYETRKFAAALKGVDLDAESGRTSGNESFDDMQARIFSGGRAENASDIVSLYGKMGLQEGFQVSEAMSADTSYIRIRDGEMKSPFG
jgi:hypothetical protein